jgi:hypothetical protein
MSADVLPSLVSLLGGHLRPQRRAVRVWCCHHGRSDDDVQPEVGEERARSRVRQPVSQATRDKLAAAHLGKPKDASWRAKVCAAGLRTRTPALVFLTRFCRPATCMLADSDGKTAATAAAPPGGRARKAESASSSEASRQSTKRTQRGAFLHSCSAARRARLTLPTGVQSADAPRPPHLTAPPNKATRQDVREYQDDLKTYRSLRDSLQARRHPRLGPPATGRRCSDT